MKGAPPFLGTDAAMIQSAEVRAHAAEGDDNAELLAFADVCAHGGDDGTVVNGVCSAEYFFFNALQNTRVAVGFSADHDAVNYLKVCLDAVNTLYAAVYFDGQVGIVCFQAIHFCVHKWGDGAILFGGQSIK